MYARYVLQFWNSYQRQELDRDRMESDRVQIEVRIGEEYRQSVREKLRREDGEAED